jgi:hypothetical protein
MSEILRVDCGTDYCFVVAKLLLESKEAAQEFDVLRFDLRNLNDAELMDQCQVKVSESFTALDISRYWKNTRRNIEISVK